MSQAVSPAMNPDLPPARVGRLEYRWVAMGVVLFGTFMVVLDTTVVNIGLPALQREFQTVDGVEWVVTAYLATVGISQMVSGWMSDRFGRKQVFLWALVAFTIGSLLCAIAPTLEMLVTARVAQGFGGGLMLPVGMAMIYELFEPSERGKALGYFGIAVMAAPMIGPVLGGALVETVGWRWLFLINIPIGVIGIPIASRLLRDTGFRQRRPLDVRGLVLSSIGIIVLLLALATGGTKGWGETEVWVMLAIAALVLATYARSALRTKYPLVDLRILAIPVFAIGMVCLSLMAVAQYTRLVYTPLELGVARGIDELQIGLLMLPSALGMALTMPFGGRLADRIGARIPVTIGMVLMAISFWPLAHLHADSSLWLISAALFVGGLGSGMAMMAPNVMAMNAVRARQVGEASALSSTIRQLAAAIGTSAMAALFATIRPTGPSVTPEQSVEAFNTVYLVGFFVLIATIAVSQFLPGKRKALEMQAARAAEHLDPEMAADAEATELAALAMDV
ncbi:MAG TPA: DHA2 family efflux MFS transporter permease subunit [Microthrixaceae bacterium]|nr:DHA2 family efflux MFS transporter permease subunit [Microthrixaceae bacterium]